VGPASIDACRVARPRIFLLLQREPAFENEAT
jgi:hypothetical protein